jgi:hypothetical protein
LFCGVAVSPYCWQEGGNTSLLYEAFFELMRMFDHLPVLFSDAKFREKTIHIPIIL